MDEREIYSMPVLIGQQQYPHEAAEALKNAVEDVVIVPASKIAEELGSIRSQNICLLGALIAALDIGGVDWEKLVASSVPPKTIDSNVAAFKAGFEQVKSK